MKQLTFYFDFISPYAYLAFHQLPQVLQGLSYQVRYQPVLFGGLLQHHGQLGPVEVIGKREWTYRQCLWLGRQLGIDLQLPAAHPFNPLPLMRLAISTDAQGYPNRNVCDTLFKFVWASGKNVSDPAIDLDIQAAACLYFAIASHPEGLKKDELKSAVTSLTVTKGSATYQIPYLSDASGKPIYFQMNYKDAKAASGNVEKEVPQGTVSLSLVYGQGG